MAEGDQVIDFILVVGAGAVVIAYAVKVLSLLNRIARALEVEPVVTTLEATDSKDDLRDKIGKLEKKNDELLAEMKTATEFAEQSSERWKKEINRIDRTIEMNSVRPKRPS